MLCICDKVIGEIIEMNWEMFEQYISNNYEWLFSGAGVVLLQIIISIVSGIFGGIGGGILYKYYTTKRNFHDDNSTTIHYYNPTINNNSFDKNSLEIVNEIIDLHDEKILHSVEQKIEDKISTRMDLFQKVFISQSHQFDINQDKVYNLSKKPEFYQFINDARKIAAQTDDVVDYELLSNLLMSYIDKNEDMIAITNIKKAMDIIINIDKNILNMITVEYVVKHIRITNGSATKMLKYSEELISKIGEIKYHDSTDILWYDHLEILNVIKYDFISDRINLLDYLFYKRYSGCVCIGIQKHSQDYYKAINLLNGVGLGSKMLVDHDLLNGYVRFNVPDNELLYTLPYYNTSNVRIENMLFNDEQKKVMEIIWNMYIKDIFLQQVVYNNFKNLFNTFPLLKKFQEWHDSIPYLFVIKPIGNLLVNINARRYEPSISKYEGK